MSAESKRSSLDGHRQPEGSAAQYAAAASSQPENKSADMSLSAAQQSVDVSANPPLPPPLPASPAPLLPISPVSQLPRRIEEQTERRQIAQLVERGLEVVEGKGAAEEQLQHDLSRTLALQQLLTLNDISQVLQTAHRLQNPIQLKSSSISSSCRRRSHEQRETFRLLQLPLRELQPGLAQEGRVRLKPGNGGCVAWQLLLLDLTPSSPPRLTSRFRQSLLETLPLHSTSKCTDNDRTPGRV
ncbi:MAG: hypothetical protein FRX49_10956 [Trebouxia sp. A1-2]|nr:MAG: hypothetical protein FRX49_10956 [Trebouxia sp. A1-2]